MAANFDIIKHNFVGYFNPENCSVVKFRPWIRFLNEHSIVHDAFSMNAPLKVNPLRLICINSEITNEVLTFRVHGRQYRIDESVVARALNLPTDNFVTLPTDEQLHSFFQDINYQGQIDMTRLSKSNLVSEWDCYFDSLAKAFVNCTKTSFHNIPSQLMYIGYAVAHNLRINFAQLIWTPMVRRLIAAKRDLALGNKIHCYYPRFLTLILNHI